MATIWIRGGLIAWLKGAPATRRADTHLRGSKQEDDDEPLYDQAALNAAVSAEREACAKVCRDLADGCRKIKGFSSQEMMQAYEYAEADILKRSNVEVTGAARLYRAASGGPQG